MEQYPDMDPLLVKCLLEEATAEEQDALARWVAADADHRQYLEEFRTIWTEYGRIVPPASRDEWEAWDRFRQTDAFVEVRRKEDEDLRRRKETDLRREEEAGGGEWREAGGGRQREVNGGEWFETEGARRHEMGGGEQRPWRIGRMAAAAAAILLLLAGSAILWWRSDSKKTEPLIALEAKDAVRTDTLPDGTLVTLNKHSMLTYPNKFRGDARKVALQGEGFFQVVHNAQLPFVVALGGVVIKDVGTSFDIRSGNGTTTIIVESGAVEVTCGHYRIGAGAGEEVIIANNGTAPVKRETTNELYRYYRTRTFVCRKTPLWQLVETLNEAYNVHMVITDAAIRDKQLTTTFRNEDLDSLLDIVAQSLQISIVRKGQDIVLKQ